MAAGFQLFGLFHRENRWVKERCLLQRVLSKLEKSGVVISVMKRFPYPTNSFIHCVDYFPCYLGCNSRSTDLWDWHTHIRQSPVQNEQYTVSIEQYSVSILLCGLSPASLGDCSENSVLQLHQGLYMATPIPTTVTEKRVIGARYLISLLMEYRSLSTTLCTLPTGMLM